MAIKKKPPTKTEVLNAIAESTDLSKKDVAAVMDALAEQIRKALSNRGPGMFTIPGLVKVERKKVPARPAEPNWRNPFTGETQTRPAKPASTKIKVRALKNLKDMV
ncbi:MAG: DNA-binding protein [Planctomycetales bacterium]|nr:DNA-binding protein [Planctomycetales bacterium]NIM10086.1 DNA-binding protein [Planctomycetales bacterium]NIN09529.1 DNA-binding protein [Planctomycetales bacterium]NIN78639.1 DNA-binding protein [Planctomycetales bacterium]NIO35833.1 DNA-binding protein [Planctomycetales bacterium]